MPIVIKVPPVEIGFNEKTKQFITFDGATLILEHSLISLSKWEAIWKIPFLDKNTKLTREQTESYVECMTLNKQSDPKVYHYLSNENIAEIEKYIGDDKTATWFTNNNPGKSKSKSEVITSELIYYWMISWNIPVEFEKWHLSRLIALVRICNVKNSKDNKMSKKETAEYYKRLNEQRKAAMNTKG